MIDAFPPNPDLSFNQHGRFTETLIIKHRRNGIAVFFAFFSIQSSTFIITHRRFYSADFLSLIQFKIIVKLYYIHFNFISFHFFFPRFAVQVQFDFNQIAMTWYTKGSNNKGWMGEWTTTVTVQLGGPGGEQKRQKTEKSAQKKNSIPEAFLFLSLQFLHPIFLRFHCVYLFFVGCRVAVSSAMCVVFSSHQIYSRKKTTYKYI